MKAVGTEHLEPYQLVALLQALDKEDRLEDSLKILAYLLVRVDVWGRTKWLGTCLLGCGVSLQSSGCVPHQGATICIDRMWTHPARLVMQERGFAPNTFVYSVLADSFARIGQPELVLQAIEEAHRRGLRVTEHYFTLLVKAYGKSRRHVLPPFEVLSRLL
jgi:pentatricopeptide repeat protein